MSRTSVVVGGLIWSVLGGCVVVGPGGDAGGDVGVDAGGDSVDNLEMVVLRTNHGADGLLLEEAAAGAAVAVDLAGDNRRELTADSEGKVRIEGVDWSAGTINITVYHPCCALSSAINIDRARWDDFMANSEGDLVEWPLLAPDEERELVTVSGTAAGMMDPAHMMTVSADTAVTAHQQAGASWSLEVPPDRPFTIVALEWGAVATPTVGPRGVEQLFYQWTSLEHPGVSEDTPLSLDFANALTPVSYTGTVALPTEFSGPFFDVAGLYPTIYEAGERHLFMGAVTRVDVTSDGLRWEFEGEYVNVADRDLVTNYRSYSTDPAIAGWSTSWVAGVPGSHTTALVLAEPPLVAAPIVPGSPYRLDAHLTWQRRAADIASGDLWQYLQLFRPAVGGPARLIWMVYLGKTETFLDMPALPSGLNRGDVLGTATLQGYLRCMSADEESREVLRDATAGPLPFNP